MLQKNKYLNSPSSFVNYLAPILIIILAIFLRFYKLDSLPFSLHDDEVMNAYVGRFVIENGIDLYGNPWPILYFNNFGDYPNIIPMYISGFSTLIFGVNAFATRFPIAVFGVLAVALIYLFSHWLFKKPSLALLSALFLAVCPWHVMLSRATAEGITASCVFLLGFIFLVFAIENKKNWQLILSVGLFLLTYLLYPGFRVFVPVALLPAFLMTKNHRWRKILLGITASFFILTFTISQTVWGRGRYEQTSIFTHNQTIAGRVLNYSIGFGRENFVPARILNNKYILVAREFARQYFSYFSPSFLAGEGQIFPPRYDLIEHGVANWTLILVIIGGVIAQFYQPFSRIDFNQIFKNKRGKFLLFFLYLMIVAPLPAALTLDDVPNIHRTVIMSFGWAMIFALGTFLITRLRIGKFWSKISLIIILLALTTESIYFWWYYTQLSYESTFAYRPEEKRDLSYWLLQNSNSYDQIFLPNNQDLSLHYLFYKGDFSKELANKFDLNFMINQIDNLHFIGEPCPNEILEVTNFNPESKNLIVIPVDCNPDPKTYQIKEILTRKNLTKSYYLAEPIFNQTVLE